jgi:Zn ribbon nucleic-acid-binding protein
MDTFEALFYSEPIIPSQRGDPEPVQEFQENDWATMHNETGLPPAIMEHVMDFLDPNHKADVYHLERLAAHAPAAHPALTTEARLIINTSRPPYHLPSTHKCPQCKKLIFHRDPIQPVYCMQCNFDDAKVPMSSSIPDHIRKSVVKKARDRRSWALAELADEYLQQQQHQSGYFDMQQKRFIIPISVLLMSATRVGQEQMQNEVIQHY